MIKLVLLSLALSSGGNGAFGLTTEKNPSLCNTLISEKSTKTSFAGNEINDEFRRAVTVGTLAGLLSVGSMSQPAYARVGEFVSTPPEIKPVKPVPAEDLPFFERPVFDVVVPFAKDKGADSLGTVQRKFTNLDAAGGAAAFVGLVYLGSYGYYKDRMQAEAEEMEKQRKLKAERAKAKKSG